MKQKGFSLIEMLIISGMGALVLVMVTYILISTTKMANKSKLNKAIEENAAWLNFELKKNLSWARGDSLICPVGVGSSIGIVNRYDGSPTVIRCVEDGSVASQSANGVEITGDEVWVMGYSNFVSCETSSTSPLPVVNFSFSLASGNNTGNPEDFTQKSFQTSITVRQ